MFKVLIPAVGLLGMVAFAAHPKTPDVEIQADAQPMGWHLHHEGALAKLAYGVENSDQLALMMSCAPGDRAAVVYGDVQPRGASLTRAGLSTESDPMSGDSYESKIALNDAVLNGLVRTGRMPVEAEAGSHVLRASETERRVIGQFLSYCSAERA